MNLWVEALKFPYVTFHPIYKAPSIIPIQWIVSIFDLLCRCCFWLGWVGKCSLILRDESIQINYDVSSQSQLHDHLVPSDGASWEVKGKRCQKSAVQWNLCWHENAVLYPRLCYCSAFFQIFAQVSAFFQTFARVSVCLPTLYNTNTFGFVCRQFCFGYSTQLHWARTRYASSYGSREGDKLTPAQKLIKLVISITDIE